MDVHSAQSAFGEALVGPRDVAAFLGVSHSSLMHWAARGPGCPSLPTPYYRVGGQLRWRISEVVVWLDNQQVAS